MDRRQTFIMVTIGAVFWFAAAVVIHIAPWLFQNDAFTLGLFAATIPLAWAFIRMAIWLARLQPQHVLPATAVTVTTGALLDGAFITCFTGLYGNNPATIMIGAAWLLWGVGLLLLLAYGMSRRAST